MKAMLVSFYADTEGTEYYSKCARKLQACCNDLKIPNIIRNLPDQGEWLLNCRVKPFFLADILQELERPIVWLDVDGYIQQDTNFFDNLTCDVAASTRRYKHDWNPNPLKFRVSPLFFNYTQVAINFLELWKKNTTLMVDLPDHHAFEKTFFSLRETLEFQFIPRQYSYGPVIINKAACCIPSRFQVTHHIEQDIKRRLKDESKSDICV